MVIDRISNLIISLKNASKAGHDFVYVDDTKMNESIIKLLKDKKLIKDFAKNKNKKIKIELEYDEQGPVINEVKRISKNSKRVYQSYKEIKRVKRGYGLSVFSTPQGVISGDDARIAKVGGELLFEIW
jgi:small subunit ribosomal protein S8